MKRAIVLVVLGLTLTGCGAVLSALAAAAPTVGLIATAIDVADEGAAAFFARHPSLEGQTRTREAVRAAKLALLAYQRAADSPDAKTAALVAYGALRELLQTWGVLDGKGPAGGADGAGPDVGPLDLPTVEELDAGA